MQDPPDAGMGNPDMAGASRRTDTGVVLYQPQRSLLVGWRSYFLLMLLCVLSEESTARQLQVQECKEGLAGSLSRGVTLDVQPLCGSHSAIYSHICQIHISELRVRVTRHPTSTLSAGKMKLIFASGRDNRPFDASLYVAPLRLPAEAVPAFLLH